MVMIAMRRPADRVRRMQRRPAHGCSSGRMTMGVRMIRKGRVHTATTSRCPLPHVGGRGADACCRKNSANTQQSVGLAGSAMPSAQAGREGSVVMRVPAGRVHGRAWAGCAGFPASAASDLITCQSLIVLAKHLKCRQRPQISSIHALAAIRRCAPVLSLLRPACPPALPKQIDEAVRPRSSARQDARSRRALVEHAQLTACCLLVLLMPPPPTIYLLSYFRFTTSATSSLPPCISCISCSLPPRPSTPSMCAHEESARLDTDQQAKRSALSQLRVMHDSDRIGHDESSQAQQGACYASFLQSISNDITHYLAHQQTKKPPVQTPRCQPPDDASTCKPKRKSDNNASKPRPKHIKRRNDTPP
ncbi:hypothetical protein CERZMDRAFT_89077 [Cercospora zeae-maydis SCOH1-5]|uniref:Uncharacterized protein n=1 Tax=Cercospora zeae-maydis SCOH1-5 TaxID=717836 RepID=A0A6A6EZB8_9PEZI|nr:hypothetical protein CERZMDRAFT_89077 [Cercospora zeae-maydis SCOH1-5]